MLVNLSAFNDFFNNLGKGKLISDEEGGDRGTFLNRKLSDSLSRTKAISSQQLERLDIHSLFWLIS
jgi:hypothetical protein